MNSVWTEINLEAFRYNIEISKQLLDGNASLMVVVKGEEIIVQQVAKWAETIPNEITCGISNRVPRLYNV